MHRFCYTWKELESRKTFVLCLNTEIRWDKRCTSLKGGPKAGLTSSCLPDDSYYLLTSKCQASLKIVYLPLVSSAEMAISVPCLGMYLLGII